MRRSTRIRAIAPFIISFLHSSLINVSQMQHNNQQPVPGSSNLLYYRATSASPPPLHVPTPPPTGRLSPLPGLDHLRDGHSTDVHMGISSALFNYGQPTYSGQLLYPHYLIPPEHPNHPYNADPSPLGANILSSPPKHYTDSFLLSPSSRYQPLQAVTQDLYSSFRASAQAVIRSEAEILELIQQYSRSQNKMLCPVCKKKIGAWTMQEYINHIKSEVHEIYMN